MARRATYLAVSVAIFVLICGGVATAGSSPQDIYDDYAVDGVLNNTYTASQLQTCLNDAQLHEYGDPSVTSGLDDAVMDLMAREVFPVSGFQIAMAVLVVVVLIVGGIMLRRLSRPRRLPEGQGEPGSPEAPTESMPPEPPKDS
ncbi:MAG: hypothetical protein JW990_21105 [Thermoleophilia bacterium]|nr:hypothetical protein [Thermoleophilia bacterium]